MTPIANSRGMTYVLVMLAVVLMGISVTVAAKQWKTVVQREKEADLLAHGVEIQSAIKTFSDACLNPSLTSGGTSASRCTSGAAGVNVRYPLTLEELTKTPKPFLRKVYTDPITGQDWDYLRDPTGGGIKGVRSKSTLPALKQHAFPSGIQHFEGLVHYNEWVFQYPNASSIQTPGGPVTGPGTGPGAGTGPGTGPGQYPPPPMTGGFPPGAVPPPPLSAP